MRLLAGARSYDTSLRDAADALARAWHFCDVLGAGTPAQPAGAGAADVAGWSSEQTVAFLDRLTELRSLTPLAVAACASLDALYGLSASRNAEVRCAWLRLRLGAGDAAALPDARAFLTEQGRMKYLRPLYRAMKRSKNAALRDAATDIFGAAREGYHPIAAKMVAQDLGVA
jgi:leukotriene-A4 hydrolase